VLKENIEHHVEEEEGEMFKKARKVLSEDEIEELGDRLQEAKRVQKSAMAG
jgi:hemerythrin-like domain-containing protein